MQTPSLWAKASLPFWQAENAQISGSNQITFNFNDNNINTPIITYGPFPYKQNDMLNIYLDGRNANFYIGGILKQIIQYLTDCPLIQYVEFNAGTVLPYSIILMLFYYFELYF